MGKEPTLIIQSLYTGMNAAQIVAIPMPLWAHAIVLGVTGMLGALTNRQLVTPNGKIGA